MKKGIYNFFQKENYLQRKKVFKRIAIIFIIIGFLLMVPNAVFKIASPFFLLTIPIGILSLVFSIGARSVILSILSVFVAISFFLLFSLGYLLESVHPQKIPLGQEIQYSYFPKNTIPITYENDIFNMLSSSEETIFIYFGQESCTYCGKFNKALEKALDDNFMMVFYYDTEKMPQEEVEKVIELLTITHVPFLAEIEKGKVVRSVSQADIDTIHTFLEKGDKK